MRKAFTLIELLFVIAVMPFVAVALGGVFATLIRDIPQSARLLQQNTTVLNMLQQVRRDMDRAVGLPEKAQGTDAGDRTLFIRLPDRVVRYHITEGNIQRTVLGTDGNSPAGDPRIWSAPKASITWHAWKQEDVAYAIEIHTVMQQRIRGKLRDKLANTHVFFLHGLGKDQTIQ